MTRFRTIFSIFFLLVFTFNVIIYYTLFDVSEMEAKTEMAETIANLPSLRSTETFRLPVSRLKDTQQDEIWLNGKLYDIVKAEVQGDSVLVYVLNDLNEQCLIHKMAEQSCGQSDVCGASTPSKQVPKHSIKAKVQKCCPKMAIISFYFHSHSKSVSCEIDCIYSTTLPPVFAPPPEHVVS
jgi:hypothetical protein